MVEFFGGKGRALFWTEVGERYSVITSTWPGQATTQPNET